MDEFNDSVEQGLIVLYRVTLAGLREEHKNILHVAHSFVKEQRRHGPPRTPAEEFPRSLAAYRVWRSNNASSVCAHCAHYARLAEHFDAGGGHLIDEKAFHRYLSEVATRHFDHRQQELLNDGCWVRTRRSRGSAHSSLCR